MRNKYPALVVSLISSLLTANLYAENFLDHAAENANEHAIFAEPTVTPDNYDKVFTYIADTPFYSVDGSFFTDGFMNTSATHFFWSFLMWNLIRLTTDH